MARKKHSGPIRDKERTMQELIETVGNILLTEGHQKLGVNHIERNSKVTKKVIYNHFSTVSNLLYSYLARADYWLKYRKCIPKLKNMNQKDQGKELSIDILKDFTDEFANNKELQKIAIWEISEKTDVVRKLNKERELVGSKLFEISEPMFKHSSVDIHALFALVFAGISYLTLHSNGSGSTFCNIHYSSKEGRDRIVKKAIKLIRQAYQDAEREKD